ncbi:MAG: 50S ribosomal protein L17 [Patescibacteria group bacterium]
MSKLPYKAILNSLFKHGKIQTTKARAKSVQSLAEKLISKAKTQTVFARRELEKFLVKENAEKLFSDAENVYAKRSSGFTRIIQLNDRFSDTAKIVRLELIKE